ncbi:MAG: ABC transporter permease [Bacillota bacterium]
MSIKSNKMRTFLTTLGVIIGVAAVIALVSIGEGAKASITSQISSMGSNMITLTGGKGKAVRLTIPTAEFIAERTPLVLNTVPAFTVNNATVKVGNQTEAIPVEGAGEAFQNVRNWRVATGSFFENSHVRSSRKVAVVGQWVVNEMFAGQDPVGEVMRINGDTFQIIGTMEAKGTVMGQDADKRIIIPVTAAQRMAGTTQLTALYFEAASSDVTAQAVEEIRQALRERFGAVADEKNVFRTTSMDDLLTTVNTATATMTLMLAGIASISLLVGGIGIMNIMLVSVTERTREIGIRKALGAKRRDILAQFLIEAVILSASGGAVGIGLGVFGARQVSRLAGWPPTVSASSILLAFFFSAAVGVFFGIYPANKASKLDPIIALRFE